MDPVWYQYSPIQWHAPCPNSLYYVVFSMEEVTPIQQIVNKGLLGLNDRLYTLILIGVKGVVETFFCAFASILSFQYAVELPWTVDLFSHCGAAKAAPVFVPVPFRQDQEQGFSHRNRTTAFGAVEFRGLELIKLIPGGLWPGRRECKRIVRHVCTAQWKDGSTIKFDNLLEKQLKLEIRKTKSETNPNF